VKRGFTHDMSDLLLGDIKQVLPRLEKQPAPVHDETTAGGFRH
jgi:glutamate decarboxylase